MDRGSRHWPDFPRVVAASSATPRQKYQRVDTHFAVHGLKDKPPIEPALEFGPEKISVYPIDRLPEFGQSGSETTPVYSLKKGGTLAVPTGKVFVRCSPNCKFEDSAESFRSAGYEIAQTLPYAPNAGWLRPLSSSIARSLAGLNKLSSIPGVENVEPQMISKAVRKR